MAALAANSLTVPDPIMTTSVGGTPEMPPNIIPIPLFVVLKYSPAINMAAFPAISLIERTTG